MTTAVNYLNRRFDVLSFQGAEPRGEALLRQSLFSTATSGQVCTGVQKLAQRWALEFLTIRGSMPFHMSKRGSDFITWMNQGLLRTEFDIQVYFNFAAQQVKMQLTNEETTDMHPEDCLAVALLLGIDLLGTSLSLRVSITSKAGTAREVILPIDITPTNLRV